MTSTGQALRRLRAAVAPDAVRAAVHGHDVGLLAAAVTFYAGVGVVPLLVVCLRVVGWCAGPGAVRSAGRAFGVFVPTAAAGVNAHSAGEALARAALDVPWPVLLASVLPASLWAASLCRALRRLDQRPAPAGDRWRRLLTGRLLALAGFCFVSLVLLGVAVAGAALVAHLHGGLGSAVLAGYLAFVAGWPLATLAVAVTYRLAAVQPLGVPALVTGSVVTGSWVSGQSLGLVLLLRLPLEYGRAYGGFRAAGVAAVLAGWLWVLHAALLVGFAVTVRLAEASQSVCDSALTGISSCSSSCRSCSGDRPSVVR